MTQVVVALVDLAAGGPVPSSTFVRFQAVTVTESGTAVVTNTPLEVTVTAATPTVTITLPASAYEVTGPTLSTALVQVPDQGTSIALADLLLSHQVSGSALAPAQASAATILAQAQTAANEASASATAAAAATSLSGILATQDLDTVTAPGMYVIKIDQTKTGAARYPAHVPPAFYASDATQRQPSTEPLVSVFVNAAGQVVQQIIADVYYESFSTGRVIWYRTASAGSLVGQTFSKDVDLPTVVPSFAAKWTWSAGAWTGFDNTWADGGLLVLNGTASSVVMSVFQTSGANPWMTTIVNETASAIPVTSSGGTPLEVRSGYTASILAGGTARIIAATDAASNPYYSLEGDLVPTPVYTPQGNGFVALGDSISTAADSGSGGAGYGAAWPHLACGLSGQRLVFLGNAGIVGQNSTQILARVPSVIAMGPQVVTLLAGTNDLTQGVTFATWSANIKAMVTQLRAAGIRPVLVTIPPRNVTTYLATQLVWNAWLHAYARQHNLDLLDLFGLLVDPATGIYKVGYAAPDNLHPAQAAHIQIANYVVAQLQTPTYSPIRAQIASGDTANLVLNPLLTGIGTPTNWVNSGVASADFTEGLVTDSDFLGQAWRTVYTNVVATGEFREFKSAPITSGWSVGDEILLSIRVKITNSTISTPGTSPGLTVRVQCLNANPQYYTPVAADATVHASALLQFRFTVPAATTSLLVSTVVGNMSVGASFTALVGEAALYDLTTAGLVTV